MGLLCCTQADLNELCSAAERRSLPNRRQKKYNFQIGGLVARIKASNWMGAAQN